MNRIIMLFVASFVIFHNADARITYEIARNGAQAKVVIQVEDQDGVAVQGAKIWGAFTTGSGFNDYAMIEGLTNNEGKFVAQGRCNELLRVDITKDGYYSSELKVNFWQSKVDPVVVDGKWQPYGEMRTVVLKQIRKPHDMIVPSRTPQRKMKICDEWLGFDLEKCDFLPPIGEGSVADALIRFHREDVSRSEWSKSIEISFANYPYAGVYRKKKDTWSDLKSDYCANTNAIYDTQLSFKYVKSGRKRDVERLGEDEYLIYRTRTKVDEEGKLVSARYGKLYGPWYFEDAGGVRISQGFMNRNDNDINLEEARVGK